MNTLQKLALSVLGLIVLPLTLAIVAMSVLKIDPQSTHERVLAGMVGVLVFGASCYYNLAMYDLRYRFEKLTAEVEQLKRENESHELRPSDKE